MEKKKNQIKNSANNFPLIINSIIFVILLLAYAFFLVKLYQIIVIFINKLINFNRTNFDLYIKNLDDIKKKLQNEKEEEEKEDFENNSDLKKNSKSESEGGKDDKTSYKYNNKLEATKKLHKSNKKNISKIQKQKKNKIKIMTSYFMKNNLFFGIKVILMLVITLSYYIISILIELSEKNKFVTFDKINNEMIGILKSTYDEFIKLKRELQIFEENLINCEIKNESNIYTMKIATISDIKIPSFGNNIMRITTDFGFEGPALDNFTTLFMENLTKSLENVHPEELKYYKDIIANGMEQTLINIGSLFGVIIDELNHLNENPYEFKSLIENSKYRNFELFMLIYYQKAILITEDLFNQLRAQKINSINKTITIVSIIYIIVIFIIFFLLVFIIFSLKDVFYSFIYFIGILPFKYLSEDKSLYDEIIKLGDDYF